MPKAVLAFILLLAVASSGIGAPTSKKPVSKPKDPCPDSPELKPAWRSDRIHASRGELRFAPACFWDYVAHRYKYTAERWNGMTVEQRCKEFGPFELDDARHDIERGCLDWMSARKTAEEGGKEGLSQREFDELRAARHRLARKYFGSLGETMKLLDGLISEAQAHIQAQKGAEKAKQMADKRGSLSKAKKLKAHRHTLEQGSGEAAAGKAGAMFHGERAAKAQSAGASSAGKPAIASQLPGANVMSASEARLRDLGDVAALPAGKAAPAKAARFDVKKGIGGANMGTLKPEMVGAMHVAAEVFGEHGKDMVITSGKDGAHGGSRPGSCKTHWGCIQRSDSMHYKDRAFDLRGNQLNKVTEAEGKQMAHEMQAKLPSNCEAHFEIFHKNPSNNHFHIECD